MDTFTNHTSDSPGLTLEHLLEAHRRLVDWLPEVLYHTSEYLPVTNRDGEMIYFEIDRREYLEVFDAPPTATTLIILHPDNLPLLRAKSAGICRLVPLRKEAPSS